MNQQSTSEQSLFLEPGSFQSITLGNLGLEPFEIERVLDVNMAQTINEHGQLYVKAMLPADTKEADVIGIRETMNIALTCDKQVIFQGLAQDVIISKIDYTYFIEVHVISYSYLLDISYNSCSFQDKNMPYADLITDVISKYTGADFIDTASKGATIDHFIMQYLETDWQFLCRMASHFNAGLICDVRFDSPKFFFGLPEQDYIDVENVNYCVRKDLKKYRYLQENGVKGIQEDDFICYDIKCNQALQVGDRINFGNTQQQVESVSYHVDGDLIISNCCLTTKEGLCQPYTPHNPVSGCSFIGEVIDVENDRVKVHLNVDSSQDVATAKWFPYATVYSSEDGAGWYAMPCVGDTVRIHFPDGDDDHAYAANSVHEPSDPPVPGNIAVPYPTGSLRDDPAIKSIRHPSGKEITLTEDGVYITDGIGSIITMTEDGVLIKSEYDIEFNSEQDINIYAKENIQMVAEEIVEISAGDTAKIVMEDDVEVQGQEVKSN